MCVHTCIMRTCEPCRLSEVRTRSLIACAHTPRPRQLHRVHGLDNACTRCTHAAAGAHNIQYQTVTIDHARTCCVASPWPHVATVRRGQKNKPTRVRAKLRTPDSDRRWGGPHVRKTSCLGLLGLLVLLRLLILLCLLVRLRGLGRCCVALCVPNTALLGGVRCRGGCLGLLA